MKTILKRPLPYLFFGAMLLMLSLSSCVTRYETDHYTITIRDTTKRDEVRNVPGSSSDNGVVFPTSRVMNISRETLSYDSTYDRAYPDFLRYGGIEFAALIDGAAGPGIGPGLFGVYTLLDSNRINGLFKKQGSNIFKGSMLRILPYEYPLRWFNNAKDWTIGLSAFEEIHQNHDSKLNLTSYGTNVYIRKRYWLRDKKPYLILAPFFGISALPSTYVNLGAELTFGSYGGFNLKGYAGVATGITWGIGKDNTTPTSPLITTPYIGIGVSALDFVNKIGDMTREWKEYPHSAIEVSVIDLDILYGAAGYPSFFDTTVTKLPITGFGIQAASAHFPLNNFLDNKCWVGLSLFKAFALGYNQFTFSVLPIRFGYRQYLIAEDLTFEPQFELNYYPSRYINIYTRLRLNTFKDMTAGLILGYVSGSTGAFLPNILYSTGSQKSTDISSVYLGISFGFKDRMNTPEKVREMEKWEELH